MFEHFGRRTNDGRTTTDAGPWVYYMYKLPYEPLAQVTKKAIKGTDYFREKIIIIIIA